MRLFSRAILYRTIFSGSTASLLSAAVVALRSQADAGSPYRGVNDTSHWLWGDRAFQQSAPSLKFTAPGFFIHHLSGIFWGLLFEQMLHYKAQTNQVNYQTLGKNHHKENFAEEEIPAHTIYRNAAAVAVLANVVDYTLTPKRLTPGFEQHLSRRSMGLVYLAFGLGLGAAAHFRNRYYR